jgi:uncharacterized membrane protein
LPDKVNWHWPASWAALARWLTVIFVGVLPPFALHAGIVTEHLGWVALWWPGLAIFALGAMLLRQVRWSVLLAFAGCVAFSVWAYVTKHPLSIIVPTVAFNVFLAWVFGHTLQPGCVPLVTRIARVERREAGLPFADDLRAYTRSVTLVWCVFFIVNALATVAFACFASFNVWSFYANVLNGPLMALLFVGEYVYRRRRFARYAPHATPWRLAISIATKPQRYFGT